MANYPAPERDACYHAGRNFRCELHEREMCGGCASHHAVWCPGPVKDLRRGSTVSGDEH